MDTVPPPRDLRLRLPGFRRYAREIERLRCDATELDALRARLHDVERELAAVRASRGLAPGNQRAADDEEWIARAKTFEYYWVNAHKKIDVLSTRPFGPIAMEVLRDGRTHLNADRLYTLWQAVTRMPATASAVAEVGTFKGGSAKLIAEAMRASDRSRRFYVCDTFTGHAVVDPAIDGRHHVGKFGSVRTPSVVRYLRKYSSIQIVEGDIRETVSRLVDEHAFGLVHIDVDVHPVTQFCLEFFAPRVVVGATIVVDDYGFTTCRGVKKAVDEFVAASGQFWAMHLLTAQAVLTRIA